MLQVSDSPVWLDWWMAVVRKVFGSREIHSVMDQLVLQHSPWSLMQVLTRLHRDPISASGFCISTSAPTTTSVGHRIIHHPMSSPRTGTPLHQTCELSPAHLYPIHHSVQVFTQASLSSHQTPHKQCECNPQQQRSSVKRIAGKGNLDLLAGRAMLAKYLVLGVCDKKKKKYSGKGWVILLSFSSLYWMWRFAKKRRIKLLAVPYGPPRSEFIPPRVLQLSVRVINH